MKTLTLLFLSAGALAACDSGSGTSQQADLAVAPDLQYKPECLKNSDCSPGKVCIPPHNGCPAYNSDGGCPLDDHLTYSCEALDFDPALDCHVVGDGVSCDCNFSCAP